MSEGQRSHATLDSPVNVVVDAFVSYSRQDAAIVQALVHACEAPGRAFWVDTADIVGGAEWRTELKAALQSARTVVCMISTAWLESPECQAEFSMAHDLGKRLVPVLLPDVDQSRVPPNVAVLQCITADPAELSRTAERILQSIDTDSERVREHTRWLDEALQWETSGRNRSLLARGRALAQAERWLQDAGSDPRPVPIQVEFISASRRGQRRRTTALLVSTSVAMVIALVLAIIAWNQRSTAIEQRQIATGRQLLAQGQAARSHDIRTAFMFEVAALAVDPNGATRAKILNDLIASPLQSILSGDADGDFHVRVAVDNERHRVATTGRDGAVDVWDVRDPLHPIRLASMTDAATGISLFVAAVAFVGADIVVAAAADGSLAFMDFTDPANPDRRWTVPSATGPDFSLGGQPLSLAVAPDRRTVVLGRADSTMTMVGLSENGAPVWSRQISSGHGDGVTALSFRGDGRVLTSAGADGTTALWNVEDPRQPQVLASALPSVHHRIRSVSLAPDGSELALGADDGSALFWDVTDPEHPIEHDIASAEGGEPVNAVAFSPGGGRLATAGDDGVVRIWDVLNPRQPAVKMTAPDSSLISAEFLDERTLITGTDHNTALVWDLDDPAQTHLLSTVAGSSGTSTVLAANAAGSMLAGDAGTTIRTWDVTDPSTPRELSTIEKGDLNMYGFTTRDDLVGQGSEPGPMVIPKASAATPTRSGSTGSRDFAHARNADLIAVNDSTSGLSLWDVGPPAGPRLSGTITLDGRSNIRALAISSDARYLAVESAEVALWDVTDPSEPRLVQSGITSGPVTDLALSASNDLLAIGRDDGSVVLWNVSDPARPTELGQPTIAGVGAVRVISFGWNDSLMIVAGDDSKAGLWDVSDPTNPIQVGEQLNTGGSARSAVLLSNEESLATSGADGTVRIWDLRGLKELRDNLITRACAIAGRGLNEDEWARNITGIEYSDTCAAGGQR